VLSSLLLSPDHAVFIGDVLIPVRYLLNGASIVQVEADAITYWHVELAEHAVILAEGLPCESYLDTGNRSAFVNGGAVRQVHPDFAAGIWSASACARLVLGGPECQAARRLLRDRAMALGFSVTDEPDLSLLVDDRPVRARMVSGGLHRFALPAGTRRVRVVSRAGVPAEIGEVSADARVLGVMVERLIARQPGRRWEIALDGPALTDGWHQTERDGARTWRWTRGDAGVVLPDGIARDGWVLLDLHIAAAQRSWVGAIAA
jgi:hypothetical protein